MAPERLWLLAFLRLQPDRWHLRPRAVRRRLAHRVRLLFLLDLRDPSDPSTPWLRWLQLRHWDRLGLVLRLDPLDLWHRRLPARPYRL